MILIVDDEAGNRSSLRAVLERQGWTCVEAENAQEALRLLREDATLRLLITDLKMPGQLNGLELLQSARLIRPDVQRLLVTAFGTIEDTVAAMRAGAFDVLTKPLKVSAVKDTVARLLARATDMRLASKESLPQLSESYARVMELLRRAAQSEANVLFTGESGTGKSHLARVLHQWSSRKEGPFVALNCASIPRELLESELFGHEKGAFTGASQSRDGKVSAANKGTLLLDEIGDMSVELQAKLLQFIQDKSFYRLGSNKAAHVDVRLLAATHRPLGDLAQNGRFRDDLLYRLRVVEIHVPALRERKQDLLWLIPGLLDQLCEKNKRSPVRLTQGALSRLWNYDWPGNIRELENVLESMLVLAPSEELQEGFLSETALPASFPNAPGGDVPRVEDLASLEQRAIAQALALSGGNRKMAASLLGISERTLYRINSNT